MIFKDPLYKLVSYDLSTVRTDYEINIAGNYIILTTKAFGASVKLERNTNASIKLTYGCKIQGDFNRFYLTNPVVTGRSITLLITTDLLYELKPSGIGEAYDDSEVLNGVGGATYTNHKFLKGPMSMFQITIWDKPAIIKFCSVYGVWSGEEELVANVIYYKNINALWIGIKNKAPTDIARFEFVGYIKTL